MCKAFRIPQCKQPQLVKPCLNPDLFFISKTSGTVLLVSYKPLPSLSQENRKTFSQSFKTHQQHNSLCVYLFLDFELYPGKSKYRSKGLYFFVTKKVIKKQTGFAWNFLQPLIPVCRGAYITYFKPMPLFSAFSSYLKINSTLRSGSTK